MLNFFASLTKFFKREDVQIDNLGFQLYYRLVAVILLACSLIVTSEQFIGDPIDCFPPLNDYLDQRLWDVFCWTQLTYTSISNQTLNPKLLWASQETRRYHRYYQWVPFILFGQALLFYLPRFFWRSCEGGRMKSLVSIFKYPTFEGQSRSDSIRQLSTYLAKKLHRNRTYAYSYVLCEFLNLVNLSGQIYVMYRALQGSPFRDGFTFATMFEVNHDKRTDPVSQVKHNHHSFQFKFLIFLFNFFQIFPTIVGCEMADFVGPSGLPEHKQTVCMLTVNNVNEKIFVFLWCLFLAMAACSGLLLIYRILTIVIPSFRTFLLKKSADLIPETKTEKLMQHCHFGDWFILHKLSQNMDFLLFNELICELSPLVETHRGILPLYVDEVEVFSSKHHLCDGSKC